MASYRPISDLNFTFKLLEQAIHVQLLIYLNYLNENESGSWSFQIWGSGWSCCAVQGDLVVQFRVILMCSSGWSVCAVQGDLDVRFRVILMCGSGWSWCAVQGDLDVRFRVILMCHYTGQSGIQGLLLWLSELLEWNGRLNLENCRLVQRLLLDIWKHTCSELVFLIRHTLLSWYHIL